MKKIFPLCILSVFAFGLSNQFVLAQNGSVGVGTTTPDPSSILEIKSSTKGVLVPRMTAAQKTAITAPATGLLIYLTDSVPGFYYYSTRWQALSPSLSGFADTGLSNLGNTVISVDLVPATSGTKNLGSAALMWNNGYFNGDIYLSGSRFLTSRITQNNFVGSEAGNTDVTGSYNTGLGGQALGNVTAGSSNVASGFSALYNNTSGNANTATGPYSLYLNTGGSSNTATGPNSLYSNTTGNSNTANGAQALYSNTVGSNNNANGTDALHSNTTGSYNTASGYGALYYSSTGSYNTALGQQAAWGNTTGANNTAIGRWSLYYNSTTSENTAIGYSAGDNTTNATAGTFLGAQTRANTALTNMTAVGYGAVVTASNAVRIGNSSVTSIGGQVGWTSFSDGRFKKNIKEDVPGLQFINALRPVTYNLDVDAIDKSMQSGVLQERSDNVRKDSRKEPSAAERKAKEEKSNIKYTGLIAQEVEKTATGLGYDFSGVDAPKNSNDFYGIRYADFVVPLVKAVQELSKENKELKEQLAALNEKVNKLLK